MVASTSFRISEAVRDLLAARASDQGVSATSLLEQLIVEGIDALDHPGITFRGSAHDRRAALAAGPDVWEVVARLRELDGSEEQRVDVLCAESDLSPRQVRIALDYAAAHQDPIRARIERDAALAQASRDAVRGRQSLLA